MGVRYLVLMVSMLLVAMLAAQTCFAHPPDLHNDKAQTQTAQQPPSQQPPSQQNETTAHEHDDKAVPDHHDDVASDVASEVGGEAGGHSHWGISPDSSPFSKIMAAVGKFHPLIVHFPIALFLTAAFAQVLNIRSKTGAYDKTVALLVWLGAFGALGAGLLGWAHSGPMQAGENAVMSSHRLIGTSLLIGGFITVFFMQRAKKTEGGLRADKVFNVFLFAMALGVAVNGFLGGALAHGGIKHLLPGMM